MIVVQCLLSYNIYYYYVSMFIINSYKAVKNTTEHKINKNFEIKSTAQ